MTTVIQVDSESAFHVLAELLDNDVEIADDSRGRRWLRVTTNDLVLRARLARLPGRFFRMSNDGRLIRPGEQVASEVLECDLRWQRLDDILKLELPVAALAGRFDPDLRSTLRLIRGGQPANAAAAIVSIENLSAWCDLASEVRLRRLRWVARGAETLLMGEPLPPIEAQYIVSIGRVLVPAGWQWLPKVSADDVCDVFGVQRGQWLLWQRENQWSIVDDDAFATLRRAAARRLLYEQVDEVSS